jgi:hypothetical protein
LGFHQPGVSDGGVEEVAVVASHEVAIVVSLVAVEALQRHFPQLAMIPVR